MIVFVALTRCTRDATLFRTVMHPTRITRVRIPRLSSSSWLLNLCWSGWKWQRTQKDLQNWWQELGGGCRFVAPGSDWETGRGGWAKRGDDCAHIFGQFCHMLFTCLRSQCFRCGKGLAVAPLLSLSPTSLHVPEADTMFCYAPLCHPMPCHVCLLFVRAHVYSCLVHTYA